MLRLWQLAIVIAKDIFTLFSEARSVQVASFADFMVDKRA
jgi:hypothetical protein